jgi:hypothetical protein
MAERTDVVADLPAAVLAAVWLDNARSAAE